MEHFGHYFEYFLALNSAYILISSDFLPARIFELATGHEAYLIKEEINKFKDKFSEACDNLANAYNDIMDVASMPAFEDITKPLTDKHSKLEENEKKINKSIGLLKEIRKSFAQACLFVFLYCLSLLIFNGCLDEWNIHHKPYWREMFFAYNIACLVTVILYFARYNRISLWFENTIQSKGDYHPLKVFGVILVIVLALAVIIVWVHNYIVHDLNKQPYSICKFVAGVECCNPSDPEELDSWLRWGNNLLVITIPVIHFLLAIIYTRIEFRKVIRAKQEGRGKKDKKAYDKMRKDFGKKSLDTFKFMVAEQADWVAEYVAEEKTVKGIINNYNKVIREAFDAEDMAHLEVEDAENENKIYLTQQADLEKRKNGIANDITTANNTLITIADNITDIQNKLGQNSNTITAIENQIALQPQNTAYVNELNLLENERTGLNDKLQTYLQQQQEEQNHYNNLINGLNTTNTELEIGNTHLQATAAVLEAATQKLNHATAYRVELVAGIREQVANEVKYI